MPTDPSRVAKADPLGAGQIDGFRKDLLMLIRNADRAATFDMETAENFRRAVVRWAERLETYGRQIREDLEGRARQGEHPRAGEKWWDPATARWYVEHMKPYWDLHGEVRYPPAIPELKGSYGGAWEDPEVYRRRLVDFYRERYPEKDAEAEAESAVAKHPTRQEAESIAVNAWAESVRKWANRVKAKAREAWRYLKDVSSWTESDPVKLVSPDEERLALEGFQVVFRGYDEAIPAVKEYLPAFKEALRHYRRQATKYLPLLLRRQLPMQIDWSFALTRGGDAAATYERDHIEVTPWAVSRDVEGMVRTLAHEMGHHLWRIYLSEDMRKFWHAAVRGDYRELDLRDALRVMQAMGPNTTVIDDELARADPLLALQMQTLLDDPSYKHSDLFTVERIQTYLDRGEPPVVHVPASPISGYAGKNTEEAFCEAVGHLVAYGPRRLPQAVRRWLRIILDDEVRLASMSSRIAARWTARIGAAR